MNVLIVYAHPEPASFNGALKALAQDTLEAAGHQVCVSDLYGEGFAAVAGRGDFSRLQNPDFFSLGMEQAAAAKSDTFDPVLRAEMDQVLAADFLLLQFPMWWFSMPAILKGWFDRVFAFGVMYDFGRTWDKGVLRGKRAMVSVTASAPADAFAPDGRNGDMERVLWPLHAGILALCGYSVLPPFIAYGIPFCGEPAMSEMKEDFRQRLLRIEEEAPLFFHPDADIGEDRRLKPDVEARTPGQHRGPRLHAG